VDRARQGYDNSVLAVGTNKGLLEAVAAHILTERFGSYWEQVDFPTLLGQAFDAVRLKAQRPKVEPGGLEGAQAATASPYTSWGVPSTGFGTRPEAVTVGHSFRRSAPRRCGR